MSGLDIQTQGEGSHRCSSHKRTCDGAAPELHACSQLVSRTVCNALFAITQVEVKANGLGDFIGIILKVQCVHKLGVQTEQGVPSAASHPDPEPAGSRILPPSSALRATMLVKEYRICMPLTVEEYRIGQLYTICKHSHEVSDKGEGVEVVRNERHTDPVHGQGQLTEKRVHLSSKLPGWARAVVPHIFYITEKSWNYYPYTVTETKYEDNCGISENIFNGDKNEMDQEVDFLDIAFDDVPDRHYRTSEDPRCFSSAKTGRGPLQKGWRQSSRPVMCSYKQVAVQFEVWGLQTRVEQFVHKVIREVLLVGHRQAFAWMDEWYGMTLEDVRKFENQMHSATNQKLGHYES
ncbi:hypothetical protein COCON_G00205780 [Conger conger]|uniref:Phosphatidylinositol transfer protein N-terminal domain-containing protein n=1 Tax=Conger conger TaxID=82655 RepID=A0A9Q1CZS4_CONCO|nr:hypothetical protein COCON_G00205780 [Conger conger]